MAPPGACGLHRRKEIHAGVDSIVSKDMRAAPLGSTPVAASRRVRVAPPDSIVSASAGGATEEKNQILSTREKKKQKKEKENEKDKIEKIEKKK